MTSVKTFSDYQAATKETAKYPGAGTGDWAALSYVGLGLGEAGEVQGKLKKIVRDDDGVLTPEKKEAIQGEIGDVLWYVARLCTEIGTSLEYVAQMNIIKLLDRKERGVIQGSGDNR